MTGHACIAEASGCSAAASGCSAEVSGCSPEASGCSAEVRGCSAASSGCSAEASGCIAEGSGSIADDSGGIAEANGSIVGAGCSIGEASGAIADAMADRQGAATEPLSDAALAGKDVWGRRIGRLENFAGDRGLGFARPSPDIVERVRQVLSAIHRQQPELPAPAISPAPNGEVLVSWHSPRAQFVLSFEGKPQTDWFLNIAGCSAGALDATADMLAPLAAAIACSMALGQRQPPD